MNLKPRTKRVYNHSVLLNLKIFYFCCDDWHEGCSNLNNFLPFICTRDTQGFTGRTDEAFLVWFVETQHVALYQVVMFLFALVRR